jgi:DNA topoisomerase-1
VVKLLVGHFPGIFNVKFTAHMEDSLDKIEQGKAGYLETLNDFYEPFNESLQKVHHQKSAIKQGLVEETDIQCDRCGRPMVLRWGRNGRFYACSGYPSCKNTKPYEEPETRMSDEKCEVCGSPMAVKRGRFGEFLACSKYPECKNTRPISTGVSCPRDHCDGQIVQRQSRKGKIFYSCSNYPNCDYALWDKPVNKPCPQCDYPFLVEKLSRSKGTVYQCPQCKFKIAEN